MGKNEENKLWHYYLKKQQHAYHKHIYCKKDNHKKVHEFRYEHQKHISCLYWLTYITQ